MKTLSLNDATATEISDFANMMLGISCEPRMGKEKIIAKMRAAGFSKNEIMIEEAEVPSQILAPTPRHAEASTGAKTRKMVTIMIPEQEGPGGSEHVYTNVNGVTLLIPRAVNATIPVEYEEALRNAVAIRYDPDPNGGLGRKRFVPQYPYSVIVPAHEVEIA
jgi:hypothetical protein